MWNDEIVATVVTKPKDKEIICGATIKLKPEDEQQSCNESSIEIVEGKFTTTKKVLWLSWIMFIALIVINAIGIETGFAMEIVGGIVTSVTTGFYLWKSKCENKQKIALGMVDALADKYGIENIISLLGNILDD